MKRIIGYARILAALITLSLTAPAAFADTAVMDESMLVTAHGPKKLMSQTPGGTAIMEGELIEKLMPTSITNALTRLPGIDKSSDSAWGSAINIRGLGRNRVVFLIDGTRVNTATDINAQFGLVNTADIERIEILKGPVSALYGSGSLGGVVNVITKGRKKPEEKGLSGETGLGWASNPKGVTASAGLTASGEKGWLNLSGSHRDYDSTKDGDGKTIHNSQFKDQSISVKGGYEWNPTHTTRFQYQRVEGEEIGIPGKGLALPQGPDATYPDTYRELFCVDHSITPGQGVLTRSDLTVYHQTIDRNVRLDNFPAASPMNAIKPSATHETTGAKWVNLLSFDNHQLTTGLDLWNWEIDTRREKHLKNGKVGVDTPLADASQLSAGLFAEEEVPLSGSVTLNAGGRLDWIRAESDPLYDWIIPPASAITPKLKREGETTHDTSWNAHLGLTWQAGNNLSLTTLAASSYRAPDLMDRFKYIALSGGAALYGNPDLDPERSLFFETGLHYTTAPVLLSASVYANRVDDLIVEKRESPTIHRMSNVDEALLLGAELDARVKATAMLSLFGNVAFTRGENRTADEPLPFIPPVSGIVGASVAPTSTFDTEANVTWAARQTRVAHGDVESPGWATLNLRCNYRIKAMGTHHTLTAGVDNILDNTYRNHLSTSRGVDLNEAGVRFYTQWKMEF